MRNPESTRYTLLKSSADLFNTQGYKATSISDITEATGYTKGAIYRHFLNKQNLESEALKHLSEVMFESLGAAIHGAKIFKDKFEAIFTFFENYFDLPLYEGGCPLMNAAVEADDTNPVLREQAFKILKELKTSVSRLIENGIKNGQVQPTTDVPYITHIVIASLEGGIMMSRLEQNITAIDYSIQHLRSIVKHISTEKE